MKNKEIIRYQQRLDKLFDKIKDIQDIELQSHWARYLCILVSGYIETSILSIYSDYAKKKASPNVSNFVSSILDRFQNPKMNKILELVHDFNPQWEAELKNFTDGELGDSVDSIVANRHNLAHGRQNVGISYVTIKKYYQNAIKVIELIDAQCNS
jgi:hypothetical protein